MIANCSECIPTLSILNLLLLPFLFLIDKSNNSLGWKYRVIHRSVDKLKLNYPTYYKGKRNKFLIDRMEI